LIADDLNVAVGRLTAKNVEMRIENGACSKFLRQTFVEWVGQTIPRSSWAKAFDESYRARGGRHQTALRALAFKWIRILYRCWVDRVPYDEARYLAALQQRATPLLKHTSPLTS
jgi:hypothetical protein